MRKEKLGIKRLSKAQTIEEMYEREIEGYYRNHFDDRKEYPYEYSHIFDPEKPDYWNKAKVIEENKEVDKRNRMRFIDYGTGTGYLERDLLSALQKEKGYTKEQADVLWDMAFYTYGYDTEDKAYTEREIIENAVELDYHIRQILDLEAERGLIGKLKKFKHKIKNKLEKEGTKDE